MCRTHHSGNPQLGTSALPDLPTCLEFVLHGEDDSLPEVRIPSSQPPNSRGRERLTDRIPPDIVVNDDTIKHRLQPDFHRPAPPDARPRAFHQPLPSEATTITGEPQFHIRPPLSRSDWIGEHRRQDGGIGHDERIVGQIEQGHVTMLAQEGTIAGHPPMVR